jgi:hydrogenase maturation protein HypF
MAGYAHALGIEVDDLPFLQNIDKQALRIVRQQISRKLNPPLTSSLGRLFDAVASLIGIRNDVTYEAQAAMEMEALSKDFISDAQSYPYVVDQTKSGAVIRLKELLSAIVQDMRASEFAGMIAARFHKTIAEIAVDVCKRACVSTSLNEVALSGDAWQNQILLDLVCARLKQEKFIVYVHKQVPTNDGGLALGQAVVANFQTSHRPEHPERAGNHSKPSCG